MNREVTEFERVLRILLLEDSALDAELVTEALTGLGFETTIHRVIAADEFQRAVMEGGFDLILADYVLPAFDGLSALTMARRFTPSTPFIFVSGTLGEEVAVEALKRGATDYVLKQRLERLPATILRALAEARERLERQRAEETLHDLLEERTTLLNELDHRVKNNLQLLLSLVNMEIRQAAHPDARQALGRVKERLQALAAAHRELYDGRGADRFDAAAFARSLCEELASDLSNVKVRTQFNIERVEVEAGKAAPMALLLNEIVVNALTHAYEDRHGKLILTMRVEDGQIFFELADDHFTPAEKEAARSCTTGVILNALARQLNARVTWPGEPAVLVRVTMPVQSVAVQPAHA